MTTLREAAQQALEVLIRASSYYDTYAEIAALEAALAEPVQEPVAWYHVPYPNNGISPMVSLSKHHEPSMYGAVVPLYLSPIMEPEIKVNKAEPVAWMDREGDLYKMPEIEGWAPPHTMLYTAPPQRKPLTDGDIEKIAAPYYGTMGFRVETFARAIERAHGIGD